MLLQGRVGGKYEKGRKNWEREDGKRGEQRKPYR